ncbi:multidrug efflux RND transporter permease subunit [Ferrimonas lipolytica]|uniref:Efflux RND transporter permease subunit n=1 Tax=Ferrimonas lipolytica TaxID=2724191 RepID=A0A6H1UE05_9GAMM|nr:multidrug efflux RND transporter permease subunit [Ferrimonas lipolytica]QIZ77058.1 efflux RND transporter permease subunit [Ferrimonas lipolytica]
MLLSDIAVKRPVVAIVLSLLLMVFGVVSYSKLSLREMPDVDNPVVSVMTRYEGASATIMETQITTVIEDEMSGISGVDELTSVTRNGMSRIMVEFEIGWDLTEGVSDVRDAVARAQRRLPDEADDPVVSKDNGTGEPAIYVVLRSSEMDRTELTDYAERTLEDRFSLISGVSSIDYTGALTKVMYVQLDPQRMAGHGVTSNDIITALNNDNIESPGGELRNDVTTMSVRTERLYQTPEDFGYLEIKRSDDGHPIYLQDVAQIEIGAENEDSTFKSDGVVNLSLGVVTQSDANPVQVAQAVRAEVDRAQSFLPAGTELEINYDKTLFIDNAINEVYQTLMITAGLVVLVLYLFIGQARATLIPAITVPVSLISAFMAAYFFGFSINLLTLMALILAIGLVVDDAIVVVENIHHHIKQGKSPLLAAYDGTREVGFAVIATTMVLVMVFLPIAFMDGMVGLLFTEFAVVLAMAVIFSSIVALTLAPVLGSKVLTSKHKNNALINLVHGSLNKLENGYRKVLAIVMKLRYAAPVIIIACILGSGFLMQQVPAQLAPKEDRGIVFAFIKGAEGTSYNRMSDNMEIVEERMMQMLGKGLVRSFSIQTPAFGGRASDQTGFVIIQLEDWKARDTTAQEALPIIAKQLSGITDVMVRPLLPGFRGGSSEAVQFILSGSDYNELYRYATELKHFANSSGLMDGADLDFAETTPELVVSVDRARAAQLGISVDEIATTLEVMLGGRSETTFVDRGEEYDVYLRGNETQFNNAADLSKIYLRSSQGELITLDAVTHIEEVASARRLSHFAKQKSITVSANLLAGATLGEALDLLDAEANKILPTGINVGYSGESADFKENQSSTAIVFGLALLVAYLVLAAQFESFINPMVVMFTVPMGIFGGLAGLWFTGQGLNIYSQIGLIMLIGMVTKNGILIVEFANQLRDKGHTLEQAIIDAATRRLQPILMTAMTTLFGAVPLILSTGAGYESRVAVGTVILFGMAFATVVTLLVIPAMYRLISGHTHSPGHVAEKLQLEINAQRS